MVGKEQNENRYLTSLLTMEMMAALGGRPPPTPTATDTISERLHYMLA
jgi:hypothetical protein